MILVVDGREYTRGEQGWKVRNALSVPTGMFWSVDDNDSRIPFLDALAKAQLDTERVNWLDLQDDVALGRMVVATDRRDYNTGEYLETEITVFKRWDSNQEVLGKEIWSHDLRSAIDRAIKQ